MGTIPISKIRMAAKQLASDAEICRICGIPPEALEPHRAAIEGWRAEAMVALKYDRAKSKARQAAPAKDKGAQ